MAETPTHEDVYCPSCDKPGVVKNGFVRRVQRFRCRWCRLNFVDEPKHRWPPDSKMLNVLMFVMGERPENDVDFTRVDRWLLEAKEHHPWFIRALAQQAVLTSTYDGETIETAIARTWGLYALITNRDPDKFYDSLATDLYSMMAKIGDDDFLDALLAWLRAHSSAEIVSDSFGES